MQSPFRLIWSNRKTLWAVTWTEVRQKYSGSVLGIAWLLLHPLLFLAMYSGIYLWVLKIRVPELSNGGYVLLVFSGLVPYLHFAETLQQSAQSFAQNSSVARSGVFPFELIPVKTVWVTFASHLALVGVLVLFFVAGGRASPAKLLWLPAAVLLQYLLAQGFAWMLAALGAVVKDLVPALSLFCLFLLFASPVAFTPGMIPLPWRWLVWLNPLAYPIAAYRAALFGDFSIHPAVLAAGIAASLAAFVGGFAFFRKVEDVLADYV